jgi:hypothetical protein
LHGSEGFSSGAHESGIAEAATLSRSSGVFSSVAIAIPLSHQQSFPKDLCGNDNE